MKQSSIVINIRTLPPLLLKPTISPLPLPFRPIHIHLSIPLLRLPKLIKPCLVDGILLTSPLVGLMLRKLISSQSINVYGLAILPRTWRPTVFLLAATAAPAAVGAGLVGGFGRVAELGGDVSEGLMIVRELGGEVQCLAFSRHIWSR